MRIKELFIAPNGTKVTEKMFTKVLISSVCSILLCMVCLISTTWAWFVVSIENEGDVIQIGNADANVTVNGGTVYIENSNFPDDFDKKATLYVTLIFNDEAAGYVVLDAENGYKKTLEGSFDNSVKVSWIASWFPPQGQDIEELTGNKIPLAEKNTESTTETTLAASSEEATALR